MKHMKRLVSLITAFLMVFGLSFSVLAVDGEATPSITIQNPKPNTTYTAYKLFGVTEANEKYTYTLSKTDYDSEAYGFVKKDDSPFVFVLDGETYKVSAKPNTTESSLMAWAIENRESITQLQNKRSATSTAADNNGDVPAVTIDLSQTGDGYYFVDSKAASSNALVMISNVNNTATIYEKNETGFEKKTDQADVWTQVGQDAGFTIVGNVYPGLTKYEVTDTLTNLSFKEDTLKVTASGLEEDVDNSVLEKRRDYELTAKDNVFTVTLTSDYLNSIKDSQKPVKITISYKATVLASAVNTNTATNQADLTYGNGSSTVTDTSSDNVYNYNLTVNKVDAADTNTFLSGAKFKLFIKGETDAMNYVEFVKASNETATEDIYRVATDSDKTDNAKSVISEITTTGKPFIIKGLDKDITYWLEETQAPEGYNKLENAIEIKPGNEEFNSEGESKDFEFSKTVENASGSKLPETGGMGTTMLYVAGGILVLGAGILLITRRRMSSEN